MGLHYSKPQGSEAWQAYREQALKWHPDKNPDNREESSLSPRVHTVTSWVYGSWVAVAGI